VENVLKAMSNAQKAQSERHKENWKLRSKERLEKILKGKMTTLMIGSLHSIEQSFGDLWNHGNKPETELEEQLSREWGLLRQNILDLGNKQIRAVQKELQQYDVDWSKYQGIAELVKGDEDNG